MNNDQVIQFKRPAVVSKLSKELADKYMADFKESSSIIKKIADNIDAGVRLSLPHFHDNAAFREFAKTGITTIMGEIHALWSTEHTGKDHELWLTSWGIMCGALIEWRDKDDNIGDGFAFTVLGELQNVQLLFQKLPDNHLVITDIYIDTTSISSIMATSYVHQSGKTLQQLLGAN